MVMHRSNWGFVVVTGIALLAACGGSNKEAEEPKAEEPKAESTSPKAAEPTETEDHASSSKAKPAEDAPKASSSESEPKSGRTAKDNITREGVFFELSFAESEAHDAADKRCSAKAKDDPKKKAECMSKASEEIETNGVAFREDESGNWFWLAIRRTGPKMVPLHKFQVDFADDSEHSVALVPKGRDQGSKPGRTPDKVVVEVPSDSQIVLTDPKLGKMVYVAKMGLFGKNDR
jgi:hypothetical protein